MAEMVKLYMIHTPYGVFYWHHPTKTWEPVVVVNGKLIPVAVLA